LRAVSGVSASQDKQGESMRSFQLGLYLVLGMAVLPMLALAQSSVPEHPQVEPMPGFVFSTGGDRGLGSSEFPVLDDGRVSTRVVKGRHWELAYAYRARDRAVSIMEIMEHHRALAENAGGRVLMEREPKMDFSVPGAQGTVWVHLHAWENYYQLSIVEEPLAAIPSRVPTPSEPARKPARVRTPEERLALDRIKARVQSLANKTAQLERIHRDMLQVRRELASPELASNRELRVSLAKRIPEVSRQFETVSKAIFRDIRDLEQDAQSVGPDPDRYAWVKVPGRDLARILDYWRAQPVSLACTALVDRQTCDVGRCLSCCGERYPVDPDAYWDPDRENRVSCAADCSNAWRACGGGLDLDCDAQCMWERGQQEQESAADAVDEVKDLFNLAVEVMKENSERQMGQVGALR
jgi:hypothetical protein